MKKSEGVSNGLVKPIIVILSALLMIVICGAAIGGKGFAGQPRLIMLSASVPNSAGEIYNWNSPVEDSGWRTISMRVTAYCPCAKCCGNFADGITACNHKISDGDVFVAADKRFGFGTEMIIPGYNNGQPVKVLDRGGAIKGNRLDVFFHTHEDALEWGVHQLEVKVKL